MVINHLLTGMILQKPMYDQRKSLVLPLFRIGKGGGKGGKFDRKGGPPSSSELPQGRREELFLGLVPWFWYIFSAYIL